MSLNCSICYDNISHPHKINSCNHVFCRQCITKWGREKTNTCPCCRQKFNVLSEENGKIIDYFIDKENNQWSDFDIFFHGNFFGHHIIYSFQMYCWFITFDEKIPLVPYNRKLN